MLLAIVLAIQLASAIPVRPFDAEGLQRAEGVRLIGWIAAALGPFGLRPAPAAIEGSLIASSARIVAVRNRVLSPFDAWFHHTQTRQQWGLFLNPKTECYRLHIDGRRRPRGGWRALYRAPDVDRAGLADALRYRRIRAIYNAHPTHGPRAGYGGFASWVAGRVFAQDGRIAQVRTRLERVRIGPPGSVPRSLGFEHVEVRTRPGAP